MKPGQQTWGERRGSLYPTCEDAANGAGLAVFVSRVRPFRASGDSEERGTRNLIRCKWFGQTIESFVSLSVGVLIRPMTNIVRWAQLTRASRVTGHEWLTTFSRCLYAALYLPMRSSTATFPMNDDGLKMLLSKFNVWLCPQNKPLGELIFVSMSVNIYFFGGEHSIAPKTTSANAASASP